MRPHEIIAELLSIKLRGNARSFVVDAQKRLKARGHLSATTRRQLKRLYSSHERVLREAEEARERGRIALLREKMGLSQTELSRRISKPDPDDLGF